MSYKFKFGISISELRDIADDLAKLDDQVLGEALVRGVNAVTERTSKLAKDRMLERINISPELVDEAFTIIPATNPVNATATILVSGSERSTLRRYSPQQLIADVKFKNDEIPIGRQGRNPRAPEKGLPWKKRIGNSMLGIPANKKLAGISVEVIKGQRVTLKSDQFGTKGDAFFFRNKNGQLLPAMRTSRAIGGSDDRKGSIHVLRGPSPYQLFKTVIAGKDTGKSQEFEANIVNDLRETVRSELIEEVRKALKS